MPTLSKKIMRQDSRPQKCRMFRLCRLKKREFELSARKERSSKKMPTGLLILSLVLMTLSSFSISPAVSQEKVNQESIHQDGSKAESGGLIHDGNIIEKNKPLSVLPLEDLRLFSKTYDHIRKAYVSDIDDSTLLEHAIRGMLEQLDPHSSYLDQSSYEDLQVHTMGEFGGLGIEVGQEDGFIKVVSPIDDTPAARAGIEAGDLIIKIDGVAVKGLGLDKAVEEMRGIVGTEITLSIVREGVDQPFDVVLIRDIIKVRSVRSNVMDDEYGYIRIAQFQMHTATDVAKAYRDLLEASPELKGLILDLRNNPGGVLQASVEVVDKFLDGGLVVYTEGRLPDSNKKFFSKPGDISNGAPIVVLINDGSASASEIVAGALQDQKRAIVMGTRSFGKGSVQSVIPITEDRAVKLTTALYYTPDGRSIQAQGIVPDIIVERVKVTAVQPRPGITEADLSGHLANTKGGKEMNAKSRSSADTDLHNKDSQLYEALTLLKGLSLFGKNNEEALKKRQNTASALENTLEQ